MKKKIILGVCILTLISSLFIGCGKKEEKEEAKTDIPVKEEVVKEEVKAIDYILYLKNRNMPYLFDEKYSIEENDERLSGKTVEEFVINEMINFEEFAEYENIIPKGTKLLSLEKEGSLVTLNFSKELLDFKGTKEDAELLIASIVNCITILPDNERVQILVEGKVFKELSGVNTTDTFEYFDNLYPDK